MIKYIINLLVILLMLPVGTVFSQDAGGREVELPDGTIIALPEGWEFAAEDAIYHFTSAEDTGLMVYTPDATAEFFGVLGIVPEPDELLERIYTSVFKAIVDGESVESSETEARYAFETEAQQGLAVVIVRDEALWFYAVHAPAGEFDATLESAGYIMQQIAPDPAAGVPVAECFVSTDLSYGAALRLGPGLNRGEYTALMPQDGEIRVLGQADASDGSLWYQVAEDYEAVNELWVAAQDVNTSGNCDAIGQADAPALIAPAAPVFVPDTSGPGDSAPASGDSAPAPAADGALMPAQGLWALATTPELLMSCEGGDTIRVSASDIYTDGVIRIAHNGAGSNLIWYERSYTYTLTNHGGGYFTSENLLPEEPDVYGALRLHVSGSTTMSGEVAIAMLDAPCSGTLPISFSYRG